MELVKAKIHTDEKTIDSLLANLIRNEAKYNDYEFPKVTIVLPTNNNAQSIAGTLESILKQDYPDFEVLVIDAGSSDRTLEIVKSFQHDKVHIYSVSTNRRYEMLNKGITQASGTYINFLFPGDFYIYQDTFKWMMSLALDQERPHMVFCGALLRDGRDVKILFRPFTPKLLKKGQQPTSLQSMWFRSDLFKELGKFDTDLSQRGGYEFLCRLSLKENAKILSSSRVFTDYDLRLVTYKMVVRHFIETLQTIFKYFGFWSMLRWLFLQKDLRRFATLWMRTLRVAFLGK